MLLLCCILKNYLTCAPLCHRHQQLLALEREKLAANKEVMAMFASALNNMATAVSKVADLLQQC
jgi:hypothetical protein